MFRRLILVFYNPIEHTLTWKAEILHTFFTVLLGFERVHMRSVSISRQVQSGNLVAQSSVARHKTRREHFETKSERPAEIRPIVYHIQLVQCDLVLVDVVL